MTGKGRLVSSVILQSSCDDLRKTRSVNNSSRKGEGLAHESPSLYKDNIYITLSRTQRTLQKRQQRDALFSSLLNIMPPHRVFLKKQIKEETGSSDEIPEFT
ncbi:hypothetical protein STEG23_014116, partial [Scotinomys teguina]